MRVLTVANGGVDDGDRTHDHRNHNPALYQLSYVHHRLIPTAVLCGLPLETSGLFGAPGRTRTCDPRLRRPLLYPAELRAPARRGNPAFGRGRGIRTPDILLPKQARYQTALYPGFGYSSKNEDPEEYAFFFDQSTDTIGIISSKIWVASRDPWWMRRARPPCRVTDTERRALSTLQRSRFCRVDKRSASTISLAAGTLSAAATQIWKRCVGSDQCPRDLVGPPVHQPRHTPASAWVRSAARSAQVSSPTDNRTRPSLMPCRARSSGA